LPVRAKSPNPFIYGIDQQVLKTVEENANFYILKYKENRSNMRQASAFLALLLNMISKVMLKMILNK